MDLRRLLSRVLDELAWSRLWGFVGLLLALVLSPAVGGEPSAASGPASRDMAVAPSATPQDTQPAAPHRDTGPRQLGANDYQESWRQASRGPDLLGQRLRSHRVRLNDQGMLEGQLNALDPASGDLIPLEHVAISFLQKGRQVQRAEPKGNGQFTATGIAPGVYGLVAAGSDGFLAYTVHVLGPSVPEGDAAASFSPVIRRVSFQEVESALRIDSLAVPPSNFNALKRLIRQHVPGLAYDSQLIEPARTQIPGGALSYEAERGYPAGPELFHRGQVDGRQPDPATTIRQHTAYVRPDGVLVGRVRRLHQDTGRPMRPHQTGVHLLQDDEEVAGTTVDENSRFEFPGIKPGVYSLVAAGPEGFAAFSINVETAPSGLAASARLGHVVPVNLGLQPPLAPLEIDLALVGPENFAALWSDLVNDFGMNPPAAQGGALPGPAGPAPAAPSPPDSTGYPTGGGGGGGGDAGGIAGAAAALGAAGLGSSNGNSNSGTPPLVSPFAP